MKSCVKDNKYDSVHSFTLMSVCKRNWGKWLWFCTRQCNETLIFQCYASQMRCKINIITEYWEAWRNAQYDKTICRTREAIIPLFFLMQLSALCCLLLTSFLLWMTDGAVWCVPLEEADSLCSLMMETC